MPKFRVFMKPIDKDDIDIVKVLPLDKPFTEAKVFDTKEQAEVYVIANTTTYIIREDKDEQ
jgi:hypothetical protein